MVIVTAREEHLKYFKDMLDHNHMFYEYIFLIYTVRILSMRFLTSDVIKLEQLRRDMRLKSRRVFLYYLEINRR